MKNHLLMNSLHYLFRFCRPAPFLSILSAGISLLTLFTVNACAERLIYDLSWTGIKAGSAVQEYTEEKDSVRIVSTARSADWISVFFPVEDRVVSILSKGTPSQFGLPRNFRMTISEGNHRRDREIIFNHGKKQALFIDHRSGEKAEVAIGADTYDTYSSFYYVRRMALVPGKSVYISILDNKELYDIEIQVLKKERLKTVLGEVNTILIKPLIKTEGIFNRKGAIYIWLTDDARRIPVLMKTKVAIGSITATLVGGVY